MVRLQVLWRLCRVGEHLMLGALLTLALGLVRHPPARIARWWHSRLCRILRVSVLLENEASGTGGLLVCNHVSWLDIPVLGSLRSLRFIAKSEVRCWPLAGWLATRVGTPPQPSPGGPAIHPPGPGRYARRALRHRRHERKAEPESVAPQPLPCSWT